MGIHGLGPFLKKRGLVHTFADQQSIYAKYKGKSVAVDVAGFLYKYKYLHPDEPRQVHQNFLLMYQTWTTQVESQMIFVFDGPDATIAKAPERARRKRKRDEASQRITKHNQQIKSQMTATLARGALDAREMATLESQLKREPTVVTKQDIVALKQFFEEQRIPYLCSTGEAEQACAWMTQTPRWHSLHVDIVISDDFDTLVCGGCDVIRFYGHSHFPSESIRLGEVLKGLGLSRIQFVDLCILCGCDFTKSTLPGIGVVRAYQLVQKFGDIESMHQNRATLSKYRRKINSDPVVYSSAADNAAWNDFDYKAARTIFMDRKFPFTTSPYMSLLGALDVAAIATYRQHRRHT